MLTQQNRPKAKRARHVFADYSRTSNGTEANAPNGKAPCYRGKSNTVSAACQSEHHAETVTAQAQSRNGRQPFEVESGWNLKIKDYGQGQRFTRVLNDTLRDTRLIGLPFKVLCYLLAKPKGWQISMVELRRELGSGKEALQAAMQTLQSIGHARLYRNAHARWHWQARESLDADWPSDGSVGKIEHYNQGQFYTPILTATLRDKSLGGTALKIVCDTLSRRVTWQLRLWELQQRWSLSEYLINKAMRQAAGAGYALLTLSRYGRRWRIRESPSKRWSEPSPKKPIQRKPHPEKTRPYTYNGSPTNERVSKNDPRHITDRDVVSEGEDLASPSSWRDEYTPEALEVIDDYNARLVPRGWRPVDCYSPELALVLDIFMGCLMRADFIAMLDEAADERDAGDSIFSNIYNAPRGNKLIRILWTNY